MRRLAGVVGALALALTAAAPVLGRQAGPGTGGWNAADVVDRDYVVLVSFDGFRHDYLDRGITPNFERLIRRGARAEALIPVFPTKTYPNHYSIATGQYAGRHGLVGNDFYDPGWDAFYRLRDRSAVEDGRWYGGEPIWVTAEKQGMVSAAMFFIGTEAPVQGIQPTYWTRYEHELPAEARIGKVLEWLSMPAGRRPHMITLYFAITDDEGHRHGPASAATDSAIAEADRALGRLLDGIGALPHGDRVNIVIVSDHGMTPADGGRVVLDEYADLSGLTVVDAGPIASIHVNGDTARRNAVRRDLERAPGMRVFLREEIPDEWQVRENPRIGDLLIVADEGWLLRRANRRGEANPATHGWAPAPSMYGIFVAAGPGVRSGVSVPAFENIHIYPFLAVLLGLEPNGDIDGRAEVLAPILSRSARSHSNGRGR